MFSKGHHGFTLAELLVSLLILSIIATFTIPKILNSQQSAQKKAVFKESIGTIQAGIYQSIQKGDFMIGTHICSASTPMTNANLAVLMRSFLNYVNYDSTNRIFTLHNGSTITHYSGVTLDFTVDWNGTSGPNLIGDDQVKFYFNDCTDTAILDASNQLAPNRFGADPASVSFWKNLFL